MNKLMDKLINNIKFDKKYVLFALIIVILGVIAGSLFVIILNSSDKILITEYISEYIDNIKNNTISYFNIFKNSMCNNLIIVTIFIIMGITCFLFFINIILLFYKSFVIGFSISSFIYTYKLKGTLFSFMYIFPHLILNIVIFLLLTAYTTRFSFKMISNILKKKNINIAIYFKKYISLLFMSIIVISITSLYEGYVLPKIIKIIINF